MRQFTRCSIMARMPRAVAIALVLLLSAAAANADVLSPDRLGDARRFYNKQLFEMAIKAASESREAGFRKDEASLIIARSHLERFRQTRDAQNLTAAREALRLVDASQLTAP